MFHLAITSTACFFALQLNTEQDRTMTISHVHFQLSTLRHSYSSVQQRILSSPIMYVHMLKFIQTVMLACVYVHSVCNHSMYIFSQLVGLSIKGHSIRLHVNAAGLIAAHPANRSTVEGGPAANVMLVHHCRFRLLFGCLSVWQLEFHELVGLFKASEGYGSPNKAR